MNFNRTQNAYNYFFYGALNRVVTTFFPFLLRTLFIYYLGEEYLGVNSLFTAILGVLSLAELGFGNAVSVSMHKPVAENDVPMVCALMALYRKIYRMVGCFVLVVGLALIPFLEHFVSGDCPTDLDIYVLYLMYLLSSAFGYFLFAYKQALLGVHQRGDIIEKVSIVCKIATVILQAVAIVVWRNMYLYIAFNIINAIANNLLCAYIVSKQYPQYQCAGNVPKETLHQIYKKVSALLIQKLGQKLSTQLDTIIVSAFLGLVLVARYSNYLYLATSVGAFVQMFFGSMTAGIANSMVVEQKTHVYAIFLKIQFIGGWIVGWCSICLMVLSQHFMQLWLGEEMMLGNSTVICVVIYFYVTYNKRLVVTFKDAAGMWWEDKWKPLVAGLVNLAINIALVRTIGVNGVIISTIITYLFIEIPWETTVLYRCYFKSSMVEYFKRHFTYFLVVLLAGFATYAICACLPDAGVLPFLLKGVICVIVPNLILTVFYHKKPEFAEAISLGKRLLLKK